MYRELGAGGAARNYSTGIIYNSLGLLQKEQFGTDEELYNKLFYNSRGQLSEIRVGTTYTGPADINSNRGAILNHYSGQCPVICNGTDNNGNLKKQEFYIPDNDQVSSYSTYTQSYNYDSLNRLQQVSASKYVNGSVAGTNTLTQEYVYDRYGNRTIDQAGTSSELNRTQFSVDAGTNRLYAPNDPTHQLMSYDAAGNLENDGYTSAGSANGVATRAYDAENRMVTALEYSGQTSRYSYNANGQRVRRNVNGVETWQVYGMGGELLAEYAANGTPTAPQKEYGYRNGQMLVVAQPSSSLPVAPGGLAVTSASGASISLSWTASNANKYRIERGSRGLNPGDPIQYTFVNTSPSASFIDSGVTSGVAYLYRVCGANAANNCVTPYSHVTMAAAFNFTDDPIVTATDHANGINTNLPLTTIKAVHLTELRRSVNAVRRLAGLAEDLDPNENLLGVEVQATHIAQLRTKLDQALTALQIATLAYTDNGLATAPTGTVWIKAKHFAELRERSTRGTGTSGAGTATTGLQWLVADQLGTLRMIFDQTGSLANVSRHDYLPFGEELLSSTGVRNTVPGYFGTDVRQKFTSKERDDETGLDYFLARYYSSAQGRFASPDEFKGGPNEIYVLGSGNEQKQALPYAEITDPQSINKYQYAYNNPLRFVDPDGHQGEENWLTRLMRYLVGQANPEERAAEGQPRSGPLSTDADTVTAQNIKRVGDNSLTVFEHGEKYGLDFGVTDLARKMDRKDSIGTAVAAAFLAANVLTLGRGGNLESVAGQQLAKRFTVRKGESLVTAKGVEMADWLAVSKDGGRGIVMEVFTGTNKSITKIAHQLMNGRAHLLGEGVNRVDMYVVVNSERSATRVRQQLGKLVRDVKVFVFR